MLRPQAGLSDNATYLPKSIHPKYCGNSPRTDLEAAAEECRMCVCGAVEGLLKKVRQGTCVLAELWVSWEGRVGLQRGRCRMCVCGAVEGLLKKVR